MRGRSAFARTYASGLRRRCGGVTVIIAEGPAGPPTVAFVAGRKVGSAAVRNRAKRRMREAASCSPLKPDTVYVLIAERSVVTADFDDLVEWITKCVEIKRTEER